MKKLFTLVFMALALTANAQEQKKTTTIELPQWIRDIKFSGYGIMQYQAQNPNEKSENAFNLRLLRFILDGKIGDVAWRAQLQGSSNAGPGNPTVMLVDLFAEWQKYDFFRVKPLRHRLARYEADDTSLPSAWQTDGIAILCRCHDHAMEASG